ncbi:hypothetical protein LSM04_004412 [Trypanosoma melophagium]|uniref:uncharacterized protein n=1 Tax=Trypanosoma melophagium TaxID=715481 RepID=UPI00351A9E58|nr:hypothetical protein LSM04_004412 [Trypanosoma melophagium]
MSISATVAASCAYHPSFSPSKHNNSINTQSLQLQKKEKDQKYHYQNKDGQHSDDSCLRDTFRGVLTTPLLPKEDVTFLFSSMTWNVDLLEVLLAKAPNPLHSEIKSEEHKKITTVIEHQPSLSAVAAFPSLEEALMEAATTAATATAKNNKNSLQNNNKKKNGNYNRRSKRRKVRRGRTIELRLPFVTSISEEQEDFGDEEDDYGEQEEMEVKKDNTHAVTTILHNTCDMRPIKESYSTYTTEEEDSDTGFVPHRCLEVRKASLSSESPDVGVVVAPLISNISKNDDVFSTEMTMKNEGKHECLKNNSMRDFLRQFYQSFLLVVAAQVRQDQQKSSISQSRSLSSLEYRALCFVRHHMVAFKELVRNYVMCGEKEAERRGAQPLLVDRFDCERLVGIEDWAPPHAQVYIAGKEPASQPLLLEILHITRVLQCYAEPQTLVQPPHDNTRSTRNATRPRDMASDALYYWRRLLLERPNSCNSNSMSCNEGGMTNNLFFSNEEWEFAYELFTNSLAPLVWTPYTTFGPYMVYSSKLPYTNRSITKLVLPAEDRNSYDLSAHFQEGVFRFLHGTPLFPIDEFSQDFDMNKQRFSSQSSLLHCSAGMHRSSGIAIAYLLWLIALSHGKLPAKITPTTTKTAATGAAAAAIQVNGGQQEQKQKQQKQNKEQRATSSYLSAVLRNQKERQDVLDSSVSAGAAVGATEEEQEEEKMNHQDAAGANSAVEENISIERSCIEHVRQQRSMALPITGVQQQLLHYACHLHLH